MATKEIEPTIEQKQAAAELLYETLVDLVEAFPAGEDGIELAGSFAADVQLWSARVLIQQIKDDLLDATR